MAKIDSPDRHRAEQYAKFIVDWHSKVNAADLASRFPGSEWVSRYEDTIRHFAEADLSNSELWVLIAKEQISGCMEWAYGQFLSEPLLGEKPVSLGELARELSRMASLRESTNHRTVYFDTHEELVRTAREFYGDAIGADLQGGGGFSFLVSCSLERSNSHGQVELLSPEALGVVAPFPDRPDDFVRQIRSGDIEVEEVIGGEHVFCGDSDAQ